MTRFFRLKWFTDAVFGIALLASIIGLVALPKETSDAARQGVQICLNVIIPSLFPFFVISTLVIELGLARYLGQALEKIMHPLFRVSGACSAAVVLGFLGGYPVGAKTAISLYEKGLCGKEETERLLSFCNNSGPAFILGAVGAGILGSSKAGWLLYLTHTAASLTVGLLFRFYKPSVKPSASLPAKQESVVRLSTAFTGSIKSSFQSVFNICAFVIFFTVVIRILFLTGLIPGLAETISSLLAPFGTTSESVQNLLTGFIEITSGLFSLQGGPGQLLAGNLAMAAFMLGWAGFSVHCQVLSFIGESGLSPWTYVFGKFAHGIVSAVYIWLVMKVTGLTKPVDTYLAEQVVTLADTSFSSALASTAKASLIIFAGFILISALLALKKQSRAQARRTVSKASPNMDSK